MTTRYLFNARGPILALGTACFLLQTGCSFPLGGVTGTGNQTSATRSMSPFHEVSFGGEAQIALITGDKYEVRIETYENLIPLVTTKVDGGRLTIAFSKRINARKAPRFYLTCPEFTELKFRGAVELKTANTLTSAGLALSLSGAGEGEMTFDVKSLEIDISGAGELKLDGRSEVFAIEIRGAGEVDARDLETRRTSVRISGAGDVSVNASEVLEVSIAGAGAVGYRGNPRIEKSIKGAGDIIHLAE